MCASGVPSAPDTFVGALQALGIVGLVQFCGRVADPLRVSCNQKCGGWRGKSGGPAGKAAAKTVESTLLSLPVRISRSSLRWDTRPRRLAQQHEKVRSHEGDSRHVRVQGRPLGRNCRVSIAVRVVPPAPAAAVLHRESRAASEELGDSSPAIGLDRSVPIGGPEPRSRGSAAHPSSRGRNRTSFIRASPARSALAPGSRSSGKAPPRLDRRGSARSGLRRRRQRRVARKDPESPSPVTPSGDCSLRSARKSWSARVRVVVRCSHCGLRHSERQDRQCPRCHRALDAGPAEDSAAAPYRPPAAAISPAPSISFGQRDADEELPLGARIAGVILMLNALSIFYAGVSSLPMPDQDEIRHRDPP